MALITDVLLLALTIGCATVTGQDALKETAEHIASVIDSQQKLLVQLGEIRERHKVLREQFACHFGPCRELLLNFQVRNKNAAGIIMFYSMSGGK